MSFAEDVELLEEFDRWKGEKRVAATDFSPAAFLADRAQNEAWKRLGIVLERVEAWEEALADGVTLDPAAILEEIRKVVDD